MEAIEGSGADGREARTDGAQRNFRAVKILCMILQSWIRAMTHLSKPTDYTPPRLNPNVDRGLLLTILHQL